MKTDARVRYTKQALRNALIMLLEEKSIKSVTVTEVCERAGLNRATFYAHYKDCYDLLSQIENELLSDFEESLKFVDSFDVTRLVAAIFDMIERNIDLCELVIFKRRDDAIIRKMIELTHDISIESWRAQLARACDAELEMLFTCLANGLMHVVLEGYGKYEKTALIAFVNTMVQSSVAPYI